MVPPCISIRRRDKAKPIPRPVRSGHYVEDDERRYDVEYDGEGVPFEYTGVYLLGVDGQRFLDAALSSTVTAVLDRFDEPEADVVGIAAGERRQGMIEDQHRTEIFELFRWYRFGTGL
jgi:hypothetical protein